MLQKLFMESEDPERGLNTKFSHPLHTCWLIANSLKPKSRHGSLAELVAHKALSFGWIYWAEDKLTISSGHLQASYFFGPKK